MYPSLNLHSCWWWDLFDSESLLDLAGLHDDESWLVLAVGSCSRDPLSVEDLKAALSSYFNRSLSASHLYLFLYLLTLSATSISSSRTFSPLQALLSLSTVSHSEVVSTPAELLHPP